jgi:phosphatidyl-myo-inositol dimannoside synthase
LSDSIDLWAPTFRAFGGGIAAFNRELASALAERHRLRLAGKADVSGEWQGLPLWGTAPFPSPLRTPIFGAGLVGRAARHRPALVVCGHVNFSPVARWIERTLGIPYVVCTFGIEVDQTLSQPRVQALRSARTVVAISRWTAARVQSLGISADRIQVVPVTVAEEVFDLGTQDHELRERHSIGHAERVILTVGRLDPAERYKGCDNVLRALPWVQAACGPVRYVIVGSGGDVERLRALARELGVLAQVTFAGFVPDLEMPEYYRLADAFAMPSVGEGFGIVYLEAMASGVPVLGGDRDGTRDALADGELGLLVDPASVEGISSGLIQLLAGKGPPLWFDRVALRRRCLELYGRRAFRERVEQVIQPLLDSAPSDHARRASRR